MASVYCSTRFSRYAKPSTPSRRSLSIWCSVRPAVPHLSSFGLYARRLDDPFPAGAVAREPGAEILGRAAALGDRAERLELVARIGLGERGAHRLVQAPDYGSRRARGRHHAEPLRVLLEAGKAAFRHCRRVRVVGMAPLGARREHLEALLRDVVGDADHRIEHE